MLASASPCPSSSATPAPYPVPRSSSLFDLTWSHPPPSHPRTSLITTTTTTTSYRPGHLLENNIHKVEPHRYDRLFLLPFALPLFLPRLGLASRFLFFFVLPPPPLPPVRHASEMTSPIYIYGHGFVAAETASTKKYTDDGRKTTDTSKRVVRYFTSCRFDNRA